MIKGLSGDVTVNVIASIIASLVLLTAGFLWGKYKERRKFGRKLEEYEQLTKEIARLRREVSAAGDGELSR